ncbi:hypothetical protein ACFXAZ_25470 [Streptomyces sp. NPDC059477]|uniref:hypothetical protein n=1 Tax=Streptomyces sp. NPDC059477 TaxID=3346847 RepID=UPI0036A60A83
MHFRNLALSTFAVAVLFFGAITGASALTSYNGSDYSFDSESRERMTACDKESDSTPVKGEYYNVGNNTKRDVKDSDGNNGTCASEGNGVGKVLKHKTCEYRSAWPDACGNWQSY